MSKQSKFNLDDLASDFANASSDEERAQLIRKMDALTAQIADEHLKAGYIAEYQWMIGRTSQAGCVSSADAARTIARMKKGEL
jgi:hypothetical protein